MEKFSGKLFIIDFVFGVTSVFCSIVVVPVV